VKVKEKAKSFFYLFIILVVIWLMLTSSFKFQKLLSGIVISLILAFAANWYYLKLGFPPFTPKRIIYFVIYLGVLFVQIVKANLDVAYRVIHPKMPIRPGIVTIETTLKQDLAKLMLANSITLTPGTFTLDVLNNHLLVHWINVKTEETSEATKKIGMRFEKFLKVIFE